MRDALWLLWDKKRVRRFCGAPKIFDCSVVNACHGLQHLILLLVQALLHGKSFRNVDIDICPARAQITRLVLPSASALTA